AAARLRAGADAGREFSSLADAFAGQPDHLRHAPDQCRTPAGHHHRAGGGGVAKHPPRADGDLRRRNVTTGVLGMTERVLVTGAMGAIGIWVMRELIERNLVPVALDVRSDPRAAADIEGRYTFVAGDVTDLPRLIHIVRENAISRIVHLA